MEIDDDEQMNGEENTIKFSKEFNDKLNKKECKCISMVEVLAFLKSDEQKNIKNIDNSIVKVTSDYLEAFNKYGLNKNNWKEVAYKVKSIVKTNKERENDDDIFTDLEANLLLDLAPQDAKEAFHLIPSLSRKFKEEEIEEYLRKLEKEMKKN